MKRFAGIPGIPILLIVGMFFLGVGSNLYGQPGPSFSISWDFLPYQHFDDPEEGLEDAEVKVRKSDASFTYPIVFCDGRTVLVNELSYRYFDADYANWPTESHEESELNVLHAARYMLMLQHRLSQKWSVWALVTPGLASDLKGDISRDDFNLQAAIVFIRHFSERFSLGFGAAYSTEFGEALPLPVLAFEWNNGSNLRASGIVPTNLGFWYQPGQRLMLGLQVRVEGNEYHGDPEIYGVDDPRARYSVLTIGPSALIHLSRWARLNVEGGMIGLHRFEFFDGDDKVATYDLGLTHFIRAGLQFGG
jgi:hypothetical protein